MSEATCYRVAHADSQRRFTLESDEVAVMDSYIDSRFGSPKIERRQEGTPAPAFTAM